MIDDDERGSARCEVCGMHDAQVFDPCGAMWCKVCDMLGLGELAVAHEAAASNADAEAGNAATSANTTAGEPDEQTPDMVNQPSHYNNGPPCKGCGRPIECLDITEHMGFCLGNTVKYVWRCDLKHDAIEDLRKAAVYLAREIARREQQSAADVTN
ncbi:hypothetical protein SEA_OSCAR_56 [Mycobacterium phage Oscar]|nr:hypothetical protein SEA_OSCAR_56 [Mycobacterium phage Oscar]